ncbi:MFS transporter [Rathayibacter sp. VKM Ac-2760]|uniref:MFS transporter n=1 Tax=Rathayibacter sp. VKM Ac-2760 TaxID=2609253 RepID=UPI001315D6FB|nr:MFS transporter [Rathayibacter sp. VKM Ac-2760]QHC61072.1 MFS transporter [Rathayibacter sp. VKM Ac-2760]
MVQNQRTAGPWWVAVVSGMASYIDAAAIISFGIAIVVYQQALGLDELQVGVTSGSLTFGIAVGALIGGRLGDRFGRRPVFTVTMVVILLALVGLILAPNFVVLLAAATLLGLGTGADLPVSLSTISEAATDANRGRLLGLSNLLWIAGIVVSTAVGSQLAAAGIPGVQVIFAIIAAVAFLTMIARLTIPESAVWQAARREQRPGAARSEAARGAVRELVRTPYRAPFIALIVFYTLTNLVANTTGQYGNYVLVNFGGIPIETAALIGLPLLPLSIAGFLWFMKIADSPSRFRYFTIGAVCMVAAPLVYAVFGVSIPSYLAQAVLATLGSAFAFEGIMKVWAQQSFPTLLRTTAQGVIIAVARFAAAGLASVTPLLLAVGPSVMYGVLAALALVGVSWAWVVFRRRDAASEFLTTDHERASAGTPAAANPSSVDAVTEERTA